ncbi:MAG: class I SAM-dependent methyltransferase [bacterium]|nr:class I SAM-dependent methyltransferase [bacterium]
MFFSIDLVAREYVYKRFPHASILEKEKVINDWIGKVSDSRALVADFKERVGEPKGKKILDAGSGPGGVSIAFAEAGAEMSGVDIEKELYDISLRHAEAHGVKVSFFLYDGAKLPFPDKTFDFAVSVSVLEHTTNPGMYLSEILRVLKPGGKLYLAYPNKLWPKETHTQIWFLTYAPAFLRSFIIRLLKRNPLNENNLHFYTYFDLKRLISHIRAGKFLWEIVPEEGKTQRGLKKLIKETLNIFGIPYKVFLSHISVILVKKV